MFPLAGRQDEGDLTERVDWLGVQVNAAGTWSGRYGWEVSWLQKELPASSWRLWDRGWLGHDSKYMGDGQYLHLPSIQSARSYATYLTCIILFIIIIIVQVQLSPFSALFFLSHHSPTYYYALLFTPNKVKLREFK